jgi:hypothetical protein
MNKRNKSIITLLLIFMLFAAFGCNVKSKNVGKSQSATPSVTVTPSGIITTPQSTNVTPGGIIQSKASVPSLLRAFENNTLMTIKYLNSTKWKNVVKKAATLQLELKSLNPILAKAGVATTITTDLDSSVKSLIINSKSKKNYNAKLNANEIARDIGEARSSFISTYPTELSRLNYYIRDIEYSAEKKNYTKIAEDLNFYSPIWSSISMMMSSNDKNIPKMNSAKTTLETYITNKNIKKIVRQCEKMLDISSAIQKSFIKKGKSI